MRTSRKASAKQVEVKWPLVARRRAIDSEGVIGLMYRAGAADSVGKEGHRCVEGHHTGGLVITSEMSMTIGTESPVPPHRSRVVAPRCAGLTMMECLTLE